MPITKSEVESLDANSSLWDSGRGSVSGFGVRRQRKHPVFFVKVREGGRQRWISIGKYGSPWTVDQARIEAKRILGDLSRGESPLTNREKSKLMAPAETLADFCDRYMVAARSGAILTRFNRPKKASTLDIDAGRIARHIKPLLGNLALTDVDARAVKRMIAEITLGNTAAVIKTKKRGVARVTGGGATAARVADLLSGIMSWAVEEGAIGANPVHRVRRFRSEPRQRVINNDELRKLGCALAKGVDPDGKEIHPFGVVILKLLCLTGCRVGEVEGLKWTEFDLDESCLRLKDTKTGRSLRPISSIARDIIAAQSKKRGSLYVFPASRGDGSYQGTGKQASRVFSAAGIAGATPHTLRHTFASVASALGYSDGTIAGLLGHKGRGVTSRYIHRPDQAIASAAEAVSLAIDFFLSNSSSFLLGESDPISPNM